MKAMPQGHAGGFVGGVLDRVLGRGHHAVTVPPMDGALQPNNLLDHAQSKLRFARPDNLVAHRDGLLFSSGADLLSVDTTSTVAVLAHRFHAEIAALATVPDGEIVAALADGSIHRVVDAGVDSNISGVACPTAMCAVDDHTVIVTQGSSQHTTVQWRTDLLRGGASGAVWRVDLGGGKAVQLASGLAYPSGVALHRDGSVVVSEAWRHRLIKIAASGEATVLLGDLPGYPSRLASAADGGYWLCLFAPRSQLVEFVLREREFRDRMMAEIEEAYWVAPSLFSGRDFREPLQGGAIKSMGMLKPWAPTRSYGLVCKLDADFQPQWSAHSRADGVRHGVTSTAEFDGQLHVCCQGGDEIVALPAASQGVRIG